MNFQRQQERVMETHSATTRTTPSYEIKVSRMAFVFHSNGCKWQRIAMIKGIRVARLEKLASVVEKS